MRTTQVISIENHRKNKTSECNFKTIENKQPTLYKDSISVADLTIEQLDTAIDNLPYAKKCFILSETEVKKQKELLMKTKREKILETFPMRIWEASNGTWKAHVPDDTKDRGRKVIQGKNRENLENNILDDYYKRFDDRLVFSNYFANWLINHKSKEVAPATIQRMFTDYNKFIKNTSLDKAKITCIKTLDIKNFFNEIINKTPMTRKNVNNIKTIFTGVFSHAIDTEDISNNPMYNLKIENSNIIAEKQKEAETEVFNTEELDLLLEYMYNHYTEHNPTVSLAILLNFQLGLRVGELVSLKKADINFKSHTIKIDRTERSYRPLSLKDGEIMANKTVHDVIDGYTKKDSNRTLELSDEAEAIICETLRLQEKAGIQSEYLFADEDGNNIIRQRINDCLRYYCKQISVDVKSSHKIRKTVLSNLFAKNFNIDEVMKFAGHHDKMTTYKYYLFSVNLKEKKKERLNEALGSKHCTLGQPKVNPFKTA